MLAFRRNANWRMKAWISEWEMISYNPGLNFRIKHLQFFRNQIDMFAGPLTTVYQRSAAISIAEYSINFYLLSRLLSDVRGCVFAQNRIIDS